MSIFIDGCEDDVTIGWITSSAVKELLSYFSLTVVEHNEFLLNQSHYIDTYEDLFVNEFGLKIYLSKDNSTKELTVNKTHTPSCRYYLVSSWSVIEENLNHKYLDEFTSQVQEVYGNTDGFGSRSVSKSFGLNVYSGYRLGLFVRHTPCMGKYLIRTSQYTRSSWKLNTMPLVQKTLNRLTQHAMMFKYSTNRFHEKNH